MDNENNRNKNNWSRHGLMTSQPVLPTHRQTKTDRPWLSRDDEKSLVKKKKKFGFVSEKRYSPKPFDLNNAPELIKQKSEWHNKSLEYFWCYLHGQFFTVIPSKPYPNENPNLPADPDLINCQCNHCVTLGIYTTGHKVNEQ